MFDASCFCISCDSCRANIKTQNKSKQYLWYPVLSGGSESSKNQCRTYGIPCSQGGRREHQNPEARNLKPKTRNPTPEKVRKKQLPKTVRVSFNFFDIMSIFYPNQTNQILGTFFPCPTRVVLHFILQLSRKHQNTKQNKAVPMVSRALRGLREHRKSRPYLWFPCSQGAP